MAGVVGIGGGFAATAGGIVAKLQGTELLYRGTVELDLFFATPRASSGLVEAGIAARTAGAQYLSTGGRLLRGGVATLGVQAAFAAAYLATRYAISAQNPEH